MFVPDQGDIIQLNFDPSAGKEIMKFRPAFVLSKKQFNEHVGFAIVAPITSTIRGILLEVVLPEDMTTQGSILVYQIRSLDFEARDAEFVERCNEGTTNAILKLAKLIIS